MRTRRLAVLATVPLALGLLTAPAGAGAAGGGVVCTPSDPSLREMSGLAVSRSDPSRLLTVNDSGDVGRFLTLDDSCAVRTDTRHGLWATDVEAVQTAVVDGRDVVFLADTGDNTERRATVYLVRVDEPGAGATGRVDARATVFPVRYPDGPADVETLLVAPDGLSAVLVERSWSWRSRIWGVDLRTAGTTRTAEPLGTLTVPVQQGQPNRARAVTDGTLSPSGGTVALRTYGDVWTYRVAGGDDWWPRRVAAGLSAGGTHVDVPRQRQGEGVAWDAEGLLLVSEGLGQPLLRVPLADGAGG